MAKNLKNILLIIPILLFLSACCTKKINSSSEFIEKGKCYSKVIVPAKYEFKYIKTMTRPSYKKLVKSPTVYKNIEKTIMVKAEKIKFINTKKGLKEVKVPALYKKIQAKVIEVPEKLIEVEIPAKYKNIYKKVKVKKSYLINEEIICKKGQTKKMISQIQSILKAKKYKITSINGLYNLETQNALYQYQKDTSLNSGALTIKTLKSLGLKI